MLGLAETQVDMIELDVGGSFGARGEFYPEDLLDSVRGALVGRPVKWIEDRRENLIAMNHSREMECELEIAALRDGTILALRGAIAPTSAHTRAPPAAIVPAKAASFLPGPYRSSTSRSTCAPSSRTRRRAAPTAGLVATKRTSSASACIDMMCADLGLDPADVRLRNLVPRDRMPYAIGRLVPYEPAGAYDSGDYPAVCGEALERIDYARLRALRGRLVDGRWHGVGIACFVDSSGGGPPEHARVRVVAPGRVRLVQRCLEQRPGARDDVCADPRRRDRLCAVLIEVHHGSTTGLPRGVGTFHGRGIVMGGSAVQRAGEAFVAQLLDEAARRSGRRRDELVYGTARSAQARRHDRAVDRRSCARERDAATRAQRRCWRPKPTSRKPAPTFEYGTQIAHVAIDAETRGSKSCACSRSRTAATSINPLIVHGQVIGASVQGLGGTLLEEFVYDDSGQMLCGSFADYLLPTSTDFRNVEGYSAEPRAFAAQSARCEGRRRRRHRRGRRRDRERGRRRVAVVRRDVVSLPLSPNRIAALMREARDKAKAKA